MPLFLLSFFSGLWASMKLMIIPFLWIVFDYFRVGAVVYVGVAVLMNGLESLFHSYVTGLPSDVLLLFGLMNADIAFNMMFSAYIAKMVLRGLDKSSSGGSVSKISGLGYGGPR